MTTSSRVGFTCAYTPLPLLHAAGLQPYRILPVGDAPDQAGALLHDNLCPHVKRLRGIARRNQVDGAINPTQWGCRQGSGARGLISDALRSEGVPVLNLEVDCVDPRSFAEGQLKTRLEDFVEMLSN